MATVRRAVDLMLGARFEIFRVFGIPIRIDLSWLLVVVLVTWTLATHYFPSILPGVSIAAAWIMGLLGALGVFASILLHELAHAVTARAFSVGTRGITLFVFGGVAELDRPPPTPVAELFIAIAGPAMSFAIAASALVASLAVDLLQAPSEVSAVLLWLVWSNGLLAIFNLAPAFPLDGGRVLRAGLWWMRGELVGATRITSTMGRLFGLALMGLGVVSVLRGELVGGIWLGFVGLFIQNAARTSLRQALLQATLSGTPVGRLARRGAVSILADAPLGTVIERILTEAPQSVYPVVDEEGELTGAVSATTFRGIPRAEWGARTVGDLALAAGTPPAFDEETDAYEALLAMTRERSGVALVTRAGRPVGVVGLRDLVAAHELRLELGPGASATPGERI